MSKAFTTDSDEGAELPEPPPLSPGTRNYITRAGALRIKEEIARLSAQQKTLEKSVEDQTRLAAIQRQLRYWLPRVEAFVEIDPEHQPKDRVAFGATVTVTDATDEKQWRIVGLDEVDLDKGWISWMSPLALALLEKCPGEAVSFLNQRFTIRRIDYHA